MSVLESQSKGIGYAGLVGRKKDICMKKISENIVEMSIAKTPQDAYVIFASAVSQGLDDVIADSLSLIYKEFLKTANPAIVGWETYITQIDISMSWGTPSFKTSPTVIVSSSLSAISGNSVPIGCIGVIWPVATPY